MLRIAKQVAKSPIECNNFPMLVDRFCSDGVFEREFEKIRNFRVGSGVGFDIID